jgi:hypothetical protein
MVTTGVVQPDPAEVKVIPVAEPREMLAVAVGSVAQPLNETDGADV